MGKAGTAVTADVIFEQVGRLQITVSLWLDAAEGLSGAELDRALKERAVQELVSAAQLEHRLSDCPIQNRRDL